MAKTLRLRMNVSIAGTDERGRDFSASPGDVIDIEASLAKKWIRGQHGTEVPPGTPLTERDLNLADLDLEEALTRWCEHCPPGRRAETVFRGKPLCRQHARAEWEAT